MQKKISKYKLIEPLKKKIWIYPVTQKTVTAQSIPRHSLIELLDAIIKIPMEAKQKDLVTHERKTIHAGLTSPW